MFRVLLIASVIAITGCAGKVNYIKPKDDSGATVNYKVINSPVDTVWSAAIPELGKRFYVINNLDKTSGLINISYNGDPEKYVDCGRITSSWTNGIDNHHYDFPGAKANQKYVIFHEMYPYIIARQLDLDGRLNLIFEEVEPGKTRVTVNTRYVLQRKASVSLRGKGLVQMVSDNISFNTGGRGSFPHIIQGDGMDCVPNGDLETDVLSAIR